MAPALSRSCRGALCVWSNPRGAGGTTLHGTAPEPQNRRSHSALCAGLSLAWAAGFPIVSRSLLTIDPLACLYSPVLCLLGQTVGYASLKKCPAGIGQLS